MLLSLEAGCYSSPMKRVCSLACMIAIETKKSLRDHFHVESVNIELCDSEFTKLNWLYCHMIRANKRSDIYALRGSYLQPDLLMPIAIRCTSQRSKGVDDFSSCKSSLLQPYWTVIFIYLQIEVQVELLHSTLSSSSKTNRICRST